MKQAAIHFAALVGAGALLSGCVSFTPYAAPVGPQAVLHMVRAEGEPSGIPSLPHWFFAYSNPDCQLTSQGGFLASISWDVGVEAERPLAAGQRLYLRSITKDINIANSTVSWNYCTNLDSFVPEAGQRYRVHHELTYQGCQATLVQEDTNRPPASLRMEVVSPRCGEFNQRDDGDTAKP